MTAAVQKMRSAAIVTLSNVHRMCAIDSVRSTKYIVPLPYRNAPPTSSGPRARRSTARTMGMPKTARLRMAMMTAVIARPADSRVSLPDAAAQTRVSVPHRLADSNDYLPSPLRPAGGCLPQAQTRVAQTGLSVLAASRRCTSSPQPQQRAAPASPDHVRGSSQADAEDSDVLRAAKVLRQPRVVRRHERQHLAPCQKVAGAVVRVRVAAIPRHSRNDDGDRIARVRVLAHAFEETRIVRPRAVGKRRHRHCRR